MSLPKVTPEGTISTSTTSSVISLLPDVSPAKRRLPKARVFIHRLPARTSFITTTSDRYVYDDDFPSIAASDSTHICLKQHQLDVENERASFREKIRRMSRRFDDDSIVEDFRENTREVGCVEFLANWFGRKERDYDPPSWDQPLHQPLHHEDQLNMFSMVGYDDFMHGRRRPSAAARMRARFRGA